MSAIISKLHFIIIAYLVYLGWNNYQDYQLKIKDEESRVPIIRARVEKKNREFLEIKKFYDEREKMKQRIELLATEIEKSQQKLPNIIDKASILSEVRAIAQNLNIQTLRVEDGAKEEKKEFYFVNNFTLKVRATYLQILILLEKISEQKRILNIKSVELKKKKRDKSKQRFEFINAEIVMESYRYNSKHVVKRGIEDIENKFNTPKEFKN